MSKATTTQIANLINTLGINENDFYDINIRQNEVRFQGHVNANILTNLHAIISQINHVEYDIRPNGFLTISFTYMNPGELQENESPIQVTFILN